MKMPSDIGRLKRDIEYMVKKVLFLVPRLDKASTRYRVLQYLPFLKSQGIKYDIKPLSKTSRNWPDFFRLIRKADVVFIQKKLFNLTELLILHKAAKHIIYDLDDAVMYKDGCSDQGRNRRQRRRFVNTATRANLIIAGNHYLQENTLPYNRRVVILSTPIDMERYTEKDFQGDDPRKVVLGWIGSKGTIKYLEMIAPVLDALGHFFPDLSLKIVADDFFDLNHLKVIKKPWDYADEIMDLHSFDIGLMPLADDVWTRGKCGFKLLQCMAVGLPVICTPVGMNTEIVSDGEEGFWASSPNEWIEKLGLLIKDSNLRKRMGSRAREKVMAKYSLSKNAPLFLRYIQNGSRHI